MCGAGQRRTSVQDLRATRPSRFFFLNASAIENTLPPVPLRSLVASMHVSTRGVDAMTCSSTGSSSRSTQWMHRTGQLSAHLASVSWLKQKGLPRLTHAAGISSKVNLYLPGSIR